MSSRLNYVRHRGQVSGPFTLPELQQMAQRAVSRVHQISSDGTSWTPAGKYSELFAGPLFLNTLEESQGPGEPQLQVLAATSSQPAHPALAELANQAATRRAEQMSPPSRPQQSQSQLIWGLGALIFGVAAIGIAVVAYQKTHPLEPTDARPALVAAAPSAPKIAVPPALPAVAPPTIPLPVETPTPIAQADPSHHTIHGIEDETTIAQAVGLVVCGATITRRDGKMSQTPVSEGSCFAITADGYLLTNRHVIKEVSDWLTNPALHDSLLRRHGVDFRPRVWVFFRGTKYDAQIVHASTTHDLAVLKLDRNQPYFRLAATSRAPRNEDVCAIGFPGIAMQPLSPTEINQQLEDGSQLATDIAEFFKPRDFEFTLTRGVLGRTFSESGGITWIQHEATLRHGNSGGPLVNRAGLVLGINTRLQTSKQDVQTNLSLEISQLHDEIEAHARDVGIGES